MAEIKQEIIDSIRRRPYITEKELKGSIEGTEQNIATQLRQLMGDGIVGRQKSQGVFKYFLMSNIRQPVDEEAPTDEKDKMEVDNIVETVLKFIIEQSPADVEDVVKGTGVEEEVVNLLIDTMKEEGLLIDGEEIRFNPNFGEEEIEENNIEPEEPEMEENFGEDLDETYDKFLELIKDEKIPRSDIVEIKKFLKDMTTTDELIEIKTLLDSYENKDSLNELAVWNELLDLIERNPGLSEKELGTKSIEEAEQRAIDAGKDPEEATGINPQTLAIQLRRLVNQGDVTREKEGRVFKYYKGTGEAPTQVVSRGNVAADVLKSIKEGNDTERKLFADNALDDYSVHTIFSAVTKLIRSGQVMRKGNKLEPVIETTREPEKSEPRSDLEDVIASPEKPEVKPTPVTKSTTKDEEEDLETLLGEEEK